ncbi:hypothetical protein NEUTE2DRAFT_69323 [Neurospora tetrasperma FGSC 2509]|nr:hypothetical protein NEUTE2DRAFT_69323 [Neurospora tetrasperma FGSC 2509]
MSDQESDTFHKRFHPLRLLPAPDVEWDVNRRQRAHKDDVVRPCETSLAGAKCLRLFYLDGDDGGWKQFLPSRAQILACRMANASNTLPEQFTGALGRLYRLHLVEVDPADFDGSASRLQEVQERIQERKFRQEMDELEEKMLSNQARYLEHVNTRLHRLEGLISESDGETLQEISSPQKEATDPNEGVNETPKQLGKSPLDEPVPPADNSRDKEEPTTEKGTPGDSPVNIEGPSHVQETLEEISSPEGEAMDPNEWMSKILKQLAEPAPPDDSSKDKEEFSTRRCRKPSPLPTLPKLAAS